MRASRLLLGPACLALAACGGDSKAQGPYARQLSESMATVEKNSGLTFKRRPVVEVKTKNELRAYLEQQFRERAAEDIAGQEVLLRRLGVIPDTLELGPFMIELLTEQVAGYYDPATDKLYMMQGTPPEMVGLTFSHELVHALQDQYTDLDSVLKLEGEDDHVAAAQAVVEGQAMLVPLKSLGGAAFNLPGGWDQVRRMVRSRFDEYPVLASAPNMLVEMAIFPYLSGLEFMRRYDTERPNQLPYGANFPKSTEQILHPEKYFTDTPDLPTRITLPNPTGAERTYQNEMGEFPIRVFLYEHLANQPDAVRIAAGWDGDRYMILRTDRGEGLAWATVWDSTVDAVEFAQALDQVVAKRYGASQPVIGNPPGKTYTVKGRTVWIWGGEVEGRPVVLYVDVPQGVRPDVFRADQLQLSE